MRITDIYELKESKTFNLSPFQQKRIDLKLDKISMQKTMLTGTIKYKDIPIQNATIQVLNINSKPLYCTKSNKYGIYSFKNILAPGKYQLIATKDRFFTSSIKKIKIYPDIIQRLNFNLHKKSITRKVLLYGTVCNNYNYRYIPNAKITLRLEDNPNKIITTTYTNKKGHYLIYNIPSNNYIITVSHPKYIPKTICRILKNNNKTIFKLNRVKKSVNSNFDLVVKEYDAEIIFYEIKSKNRKR
ncbi:carboxypeptidase-like regulatory domain-containing protein [Vallitalea sp.]|uniref:carboxypeptidase-like regulatory domain-containing protein n=1 Tax=Vallitalea sp. TaxID=1882829 RepID=UPI0025D1DF69|nr:carboxypeptidase-like regulatory domain-containing protein [Vallitalea sp.]MCT4686569.1 carboxypeptidase-like regulatory domain-containing protein [Vallitalea sp.]